MAAMAPRPASPVVRPAVAVQIPPRALQISPNLEALLQHDELTRRSSGSPTSTYRTTTTTTSSSSPTVFPVSLPPPPPRKAHAGGPRRQDTPTMRSRDAQRKKAPASGLWPDGLPATLPPDACAPSASCSRPVTPNPYLNPAPTLLTQPLPLPVSPDEPPTPKQSEFFPVEPDADSQRRRPSASDLPSAALNKVEKFLWMGRDSLSLFSGSVSGSKRHDSDRRNTRPDHGVPWADAVHDRQMRQVPVQNIPGRPLADTNIATSSSRGPPLRQNSPSETASARSSFHSQSRSSNLPSPRPAPHQLPRLSLPCTSMFYDSSRPKSVDRHDHLSFIDLFSPSTSDDPKLSTVQDSSSSPSRRQPRSTSIPPPSPSSCNNSSTSLASMRFAPPSPSLLAVQQPTPVHSPLDSSSSVALSSMVFASPSPSSEHILPTWFQPVSGPPSPYSPLEFAQPASSPHEALDKPASLDLSSERGRKHKPARRSISLSPHPLKPSSLPPTTNQLDANARADRIRRNRKLTRMFGRTPGTDEPASEAMTQYRTSKKSHPPSLAALLVKQKNHRHAVSASAALKSPGMKKESAPSWQTDDLWSPDGRRHSIPLATTGIKLYVDDEHDGKAVKVSNRGRDAMDSPETASTRSFIDLSDEDVRDDASGLSFLAPYNLRHRRVHQSSSTPSLVESLDSEALAETDRRQKRERLVRLHRFLGSRVPPEVIIGNVYGPPLPPATIPEESDREHWLPGHKSVPSDDFDRGKEELGEKEKALNVRRAQKMERVFGTPPPQKLFHTRPRPRPTAPVSQPTSPTSRSPYVLTLDIPSVSRNPNRSAYVGKTTPRLGPSESSRCLLPRVDDGSQPSPSSIAQSFTDSFAGSPSGYQQVLAQSSVYLNYQHSLNSLVDIIDRDDRQSLVELHRFLHGDVDESPYEEEVATTNSRRISTAPSFKSERRHSLPSKSSMTSLSSEFHVPPQLSRFQIRRRQAAKLTNFFGVDYRDLIRDILESIEKGVEEEHNQGTLQPQEVEVLMHRVRSLRAVRSSFPN